LLAPANERGGDVRIDLTFQLAATKACLPDFALQRFERRDFRVAGDEPADVSHDGDELFFGGAFDPDRSASGGGAAPGGAQVGDEWGDFSVFRVVAQEFFGVLRSKRKECFENEVDGRGGAFDVEEQSANC